MNDLIELFATLALVLPLIVLGALIVVVRDPKARVARWLIACSTVSLVPLVFLGLSRVFPALDPSMPDVFLDDFFFKAQLLTSGIGGLTITALFAIGVAFRTLMRSKVKTAD